MSMARERSSNGTVQLTPQHIVYKSSQSKPIVVIPALCGPAQVYTSSFHAFKQIFGVNAPWHKPPSFNGRSEVLFCVFLARLSYVWNLIHRPLGPNVLASEGEALKRHHRITVPAFNQSSHENVWKVTEGVYANICSKDGWNGINLMDVANINRLTHTVRSGRKMPR